MSQGLNSRRWFVVSITLLCLDNIIATPPVPEPVIEVQTAIVQDGYAERQAWLAQESMAYALHTVARIPGARAREVANLVEQETSRYKDVDHVLVLGLIVVESRGNYWAVSPVGARGLMQIMPATGQFIATNFQEEWKGWQSLYPVRRNIRYGVWYLDHLQGQFPENEWAMVAAYNWGPLNIRNRLRRGIPLPTDYPGKVQEAKLRIQGEMYEFYEEQLWRSLDLSQDPPHFRDHPFKPPRRPRYPEFPIHDGKGEHLREGFGIQPVSELLLRGG